MKPKFTQLIENEWASEKNPHRIGYFVREGYRKGRLNPGKYWVITDGKGDFWELQPSEKTIVHESYFNLKVTAS